MVEDIHWFPSGVCPELVTQCCYLAVSKSLSTSSQLASMVDQRIHHCRQLSCQGRYEIVVTTTLPSISCINSSLLSLTLVVLFLFLKFQASYSLVSKLPFFCTCTWYSALILCYNTTLFSPPTCVTTRVTIAPNTLLLCWRNLLHFNNS